MRKILYYALLALLALAGAAKALLDYQLNRFATQAVQQAQPYAQISYQQVRLALPAQVVADAVQIQAPDFPALQIQQVQLQKLYRFLQTPGKLPQDWHISLTQAELSLQPLLKLPNTQALWQVFGYQAYYLSPAEMLQLLGQSLSADADLQAHWQAANGTLTLELQIRSPTLGTLDLQVNTSGVHSLPIQWQNLLIHTASLTWQGGQWLPGFSNYLAQKQQISQKKLRQDLSQKLLKDGQQSGFLDAQAQTALSRFIQDAQPLKIQLQPTNPFSLQELSRLPPQQWLTRTGLRW